ncbi:hypothetical protein BKA60DRAFT_165479 [Fusarium oxysporum]|nr:hypothetical protein BKA60DRAFT_165479 [Fusarium oxysporum]
MRKRPSKMKEISALFIYAILSIYGVPASGCTLCRLSEFNSEIGFFHRHFRGSSPKTREHESGLKKSYVFSTRLGNTAFGPACER